ncbi:toluene tolerance protein [Pseudomonas sp. WN033]|nr:toluene tolerance protein [Pseudomonas sp. WN033]
MRALLTTFFALLCSLPVLAQANATPHQIVEDSSTRVLEVLDANRELYKQDSEAFLNGLNEILEPVIDYRGIARSVMTVRFSRNATDEQIERFVDTFKRSLVQFYGNALLEFNSGEIKVLPPTARDQQRPDRTNVTMEIHTANGNVYQVNYTMALVGDKWMMRNVIVEGINIGLLFRDQFAQAMQANRNNLDAVIDGWGGVIAETLGNNGAAE